MSKKKKNSKEKCKVQKVDSSQILLFIIGGLIFGVALAGSICFNKVHTIDSLCDNSIGVVCQVVATIAACLASIIAISMSLQNDECFGIPVKKFSNLRVGFHFSISNILIVSIILLLVNVAFYVTGLLIASIGVALIEIIFCLYLSVVEIPVMARKEKALLRIVKKRLQIEYIIAGNIPKDLKDVLKCLISEEKNLPETYKLLKDKNEDYNTYLLLTLLDIQEDLAGDVKQIQEVQKRQDVIDAIIRNIEDIFKFKKEFDIYEILKDGLIKYDYVIAKTLYRLHTENSSTDIESYDEISIWVANQVVGLRSKNIGKTQMDFVIAVLLSVLSTSVANNDFAFVAALRRDFSIYEYELLQGGGGSLIFALISMQMYYLCSGANDVTDEHKANISDFLNYSKFSNNVKILSWKVLYNKFVRSYAIEFKNFWHYFKLNKDRWDVPVLGVQTYIITLDYEFLLKWYLFHLLCSARASKYDYEQLKLKNMEVYDFALKNVVDSLFNANNEIIMPESMKAIIEFYQIRTDGFYLFKASERNKGKLFEFKNAIHIREFDEKNKKAKNTDKNEICEKFRSLVVNKLKEEWGFDDSLRIDGSPQQAHIIIEKTSDAINFDEVVVEYFVRSILMEVQQKVSKSTIKKDANFDKKIAELLKKNIYAIGNYSQYSISSSINDIKIRKKFDEKIMDAEKIDSNVLIGDYLLLSKAFRFNFEFLEFRAINLTEEQISKQVETYKRADGQYIFEGAFLSREKIEDYVRNQFIVISMCVRLQVESWADLLYQIILYEGDDEANDVDNAINDDDGDGDDDNLDKK